MSPTASWHQLQLRDIAPRLDKLTDGFMREITAGSDSESAKDLPWASNSFSLTQNEAAERWKSTMVDDCVQFLAKHNRLGSPWQFLFIISKEEIAPRIQELLHAAFRVTRTDTELIERWYGTRSLPADPGIGRPLNIARTKQRLVDRIIDELMGPDRDRAFGTPDAPKFDVPSTQINAATSPKVPRGSPTVASQAEPTSANAARTVSTSPRPHANERSQTADDDKKPKRGRPRKDDVAGMIDELRANRKRWPQVADEVNRKFPQNKTNAEACRKLWESRNKRRHKNERS
jgi:hypothetical protein